MEPKPEQVIIDPVTVNLIFAGYDDFVKALEWPATIMTQAEEMGYAGMIELSADSGDTAEDKPLMSIFGPRAAVNIIVEGLEKEDVKFVIDRSESDEPNIVQRKWKDRSKSKE